MQQEMDDADIVYLQNLVLKYTPHLILFELGEVYARRLKSLRQDLPPGETSSTTVRRADTACQQISTFAYKFKEDGFI